MPKLPEPNKQSLANLIKIAAHIGKQLQQIPIKEIMKWNSYISYSCDEVGNLNGLNLRESKLSDISFLTDILKTLSYPVALLLNGIEKPDDRSVFSPDCRFRMNCVTFYLFSSMLHHLLKCMTLFHQRCIL